MRDALYKALRWLINQIFKAPYIDSYEPVPRVPAKLAKNLTTMVKAADLNPTRHMPYLMGNYRAIVGIVGSSRSANKMQLTLVGGLQLEVFPEMYLEVMLAPHIDVGENTRDYGNITSRLQSQGEEG